MAWSDILGVLGLGFLGNQQASDQADAIRESANISSNASIEAAKLQRDAYLAGLALQDEQFKVALEEARKGNTEALATFIAGQQASYDIGRQNQQQAINWALPQKIASVSALQSSLPAIQKALGLTAYQLPTSVDTTPLPEINFNNLYNQAIRNQYAQNNLNEIASTGTPMTPSGRIPDPIPGQSASILPSQTSPSDEQLKTSYLNLEALPSNIFTQQGAISYPETLPYQVNRSSIGSSYNSPALSNNQSTPMISDAQLSELQNKIYQAQSLGKSDDEQRYTDIYNYYRGYGLSPNSIALDYVAPSTQETTTQETPQTTVNPTINYTNPITPSTRTSYDLIPMNNDEIADFTSSPLYDWQLQELSDAERKRQIKEGLANSTYGNRELNRIQQGLAATERDKWLSNQMQLLSYGMGNTSALPTPSTNISDISNLYSSAGKNLSNLYTDYGKTLGDYQQAIGNISAQGLLNSGQAQSLATQQIGQVTPWWQNAINYAGALKTAGVW